jgi:hypothetical protein
MIFLIILQDIFLFLFQDNTFEMKMNERWEEKQMIMKTQMNGGHVAG